MSEINEEKLCGKQGYGRDTGVVELLLPLPFLKKSNGKRQERYSRILLPGTLGSQGFNALEPRCYSVGVRNILVLLSTLHCPLSPLCRTAHCVVALRHAALPSLAATEWDATLNRDQAS